MLSLSRKSCFQSSFPRLARPALSKSTSCRLVMAAAAKSVLVPIANGSEEMEAVIVIDCLRRAGAPLFYPISRYQPRNSQTSPREAGDAGAGAQVSVASVEDTSEIVASRDVKLVADKLISECEGPYDCIALPGGMPGSERLRDSAPLATLLQQQKESGRLYAAICAAPAVVFEAQGLLAGPATSHPAFSEQLSDQSRVGDRVVVDGQCVTSRGPGTAFEFALALIEQLYGPEKRDEVAGPMVMYPY